MAANEALIAAFADKAGEEPDNELYELLSTIAGFCGDDIDGGRNTAVLRLSFLRDVIGKAIQYLGGGVVS